jgi:acyl-CoA synthetase (NDP forming)/GNAT superfamily N-acetyltransferase
VSIVAYPAEWEFDGLGADGHPIHIRPVGRDDPGVLDALGGDFSLAPDPSAGLDYARTMAFVARRDGVVAGVAAYARIEGAADAEVHIAIDDAHREQGVGTLLLEALIRYARHHGLEVLLAPTPASDGAMRHVLADSGLAIDDTRRDLVRVDLTVTADYQDRCDEREAVAEAASVATFLRPRSVAVVGASRRPGAVGHEIVRSLLAAEFTGSVLPVNPTADAIAGVPCAPSLGALGRPVDLVVVAVPAHDVLAVVEEAAAIGAKAAVVVTSGFAEAGEGGGSVEREMATVARLAGMRIVGPNCLGIASTDPSVRLQATFALDTAPAGSIALASQSGGVGIVMAEEAARHGLGISSFVSLGNKVDVSSNDLLCFWERDPRTRVIALYLESFGNPRKFARIAERVGRTKPIVVLKAGRTDAGARGARSHTAAAATPEVAVHALLEHAGAIEVASLDELFDVAALLDRARPPAGTRVGIVGNAGGPLILAADACGFAGLELPDLGAALDGAAGALPAGAALGNPVDLTSGARAADLERAVGAIAGSGEVDAVVAVVTALPSFGTEAAAACIEGVAHTAPVPVVLCVLGDDPTATALRHPELVMIPSADRAARALAAAARYAAHLQHPLPAAAARERPAQRERIRAQRARRPDGGWLDGTDALDLLAAAGIATVPARRCTSAEEAVAAAAALGYPVALKMGSGASVHKTEHGGVVLGLTSAPDVAAAFETMAARLGDEMGGAVVEPMAAPGIETIVGLSVDPSFGPLVMVGLGGVATDLLGDRAFAVPPLDRARARALFASLRTAPLLEGYRGAEPVDLDALADVVVAVSDMAETIPELVELDCNPVIAGPTGALVVDAKVRLARAPGGPDPLMRMLRPLPRPRG